MIVWLITGIALIGAVLNLQRKWQCFIFWIISNFCWFLYCAFKQEFALAVLFGIFMVLSAWGIDEWKKPQRPSADVINFCKRILTLRDSLNGDTARVKANWVITEAERILERGDGKNKKPKEKAEAHKD